MSRAVSIRIETSEPGRPDPAGDLEPGDVRQAEVEDDDLDPAGRLGDVEPVAAGGRGLDDVAVLLEESPQQANEPRVVLDDEQMHVGQPSAFGQGMTVTLPAVPTGPDGAPLAPGPEAAAAGAAGQVDLDLDRRAGLDVRGGRRRPACGRWSRSRS